MFLPDKEMSQFSYSRRMIWRFCIHANLLCKKIISKRLNTLIIQTCTSYVSILKLNQIISQDNFNFKDFVFTIWTSTVLVNQIAPIASTISSVQRSAGRKMPSIILTFDWWSYYFSGLWVLNHEIHGNVFREEISCWTYYWTHLRGPSQ